MDDNAIIELFFARSEQAIRELDDKYGKVCHSLSYNILHSSQDAEECVNDAYEVSAQRLELEEVIKITASIINTPYSEDFVVGAHRTFPTMAAPPPHTPTPPLSQTSAWMNRLNLLSHEIHD